MGGNDPASDGEKAKRILWIKEQADRPDTLREGCLLTSIESPTRLGLVGVTSSTPRYAIKSFMAKKDEHPLPEMRISEGIA